ncbi:MAG: ABC transporter permease [Candidatus Aminicenantes bacterium]|nr:ABC transporter permease [Candidatus Aminicenantes bacterium]
MELKPDFLESLETLLHHKLRTILTLLGMIFGVGAVIAMLSIGKGAEQEALRLIDSMGLRNIIVKAKTFDENRLKEIRETSMGVTLQDLNAVRETLPFLTAYSALKQLAVYTLFSHGGASDANVYGVTPTHTDMANLSVNRGRFLLPIDEATQAQVCVIGSRVAQVLFPGEDPVGRHVKVNHVWLAVVGILKDKNLSRNEFEGISLKGEQNNIYIPLRTALKSFQFKMLESELDEFRVRLEKGISSITAAETLTHLMKRRHKDTDDYELVVPEALLEQHRKTQNIFTIVMACIAGISLLVGGIGIMNIMLATVLERTREIGLRRAVGARQVDIKRQFMLETFTVSAMGGLLGIIFGFSLSIVISAFTGWPVGWSLSAVILSVGVCALIGLVFGIYPAVQASRLDPIEALRHD